MDLEKFMSEKYVSHWAENLQLGDRCLATIRHETIGELNRHNVPVIVIENIIAEKKIKGSFFDKIGFINYNELTAVG
jgi:hypothetical protein